MPCSALYARWRSISFLALFFRSHSSEQRVRRGGSTGEPQTMQSGRGRAARASAFFRLWRSRSRAYAAVPGPRLLRRRHLSEQYADTRPRFAVGT